MRYNLILESQLPLGHDISANSQIGARPQHGAKNFSQYIQHVCCLAPDVTVILTLYSSYPIPSVAPQFLYATRLLTPSFPLNENLEEPRSLLGSSHFSKHKSLNGR
ncbi:hypothetical protein RRG08_058844 [Elysia crispata]|uniref:Uncharacterized protein n=1 Tax=Elysia crispata TaxID=231223 RepID=A0AAE1CQ46_9GAST|nr:hypothetical protein RRG08_058844 [Elysia crispata]